MAEELYCDYRMTVRLEIANQPGQFARIAAALAEEGANLGAIDIVEVNRSKMVRDITFDAHSERHAEKVLDRLRGLNGPGLVHHQGGQGRRRHAAKEVATTDAISRWNFRHGWLLQ